MLSGCTQNLEWCTLLPSPDRPRESPVFALQGNEWFFSFFLEKAGHNWYFELLLEVYKELTEIKQTRVTFQVGFKKELNLSLKTGEFKMSKHLEVWYMEVKELQAKLPSDYLDGNWIKFKFVFHDVNEPLTKISNKTDEKYLQTVSYITNNVSMRSLAEDFSKLLETEADHDVEMKCGENRIKAHKLVLSARSDVFRAMLHGDMLEALTGIIEIQEMDVSYFREFTRYLYTDEMPDLTFEKAKVLYEAGDKYNIRSLVLRCAEYLEDILCPENTFEIYTLADAHSNEKLKDVVKTYLLEKKVYLQGEYWMGFYKNFPEVALEIYSLSYEKRTEN